MDNTINNLPSASPADILSTPTEVRQKQEDALDEAAGSQWVSVASGKTEREVFKISKRVINLTRRQNYGTCLARISPTRHGG